MKQQIFYCLLCFFCLLGVSNVQAQTDKYFLPNYLQKTPNSAAFEKYGEYQVNMFSGLPDISIPLYEVESGGLKVPITLSYHASGIKVGDVASWAGLGWSVSTGGEISRKAMGGPDESSAGYLQGTLRSASMPANTNPLTDDGRSFMTQILLGQKDASPDIFSYDFPGHGGKFFFNGRDNYKPICIPYAPLKINRNHNPTGQNSINSFTITDEHGNNYFFGQTAQSTGFYTANGNGVGQSVSAWMLEKMQTQDLKDTVTFTYNSVFYSTPVDDTESITVDDMATQLETNCSFPYNPSPGTTTISSNTSAVAEQQLNTIFFKNGKVVFELSPAARQDITGTAPKSLQDIKIYSYVPAAGQYSLLKTIRFYQSYFMNSSGGAKRLRLDALAVMDKSGAVIQKYTFDYNALTLPVYTSKGKDYWGYYNGKDSQTSLIPLTTINYFPTSISAQQIINVGSTTPNGRDPDSAYTQACMLQRIHYPTGGSTEFQYQCNRYIDGSGVTRLAGGLRVAAIKSYDGINPLPIVKTYQYADAQPNFHLGNYSFVTEQTFRYYMHCGEINVLSGTKRQRTFVSVPTTDIEAWDSTPVGYKTVTEYVGNGAVNAGKTIYKFAFRGDAETGASVLGQPMYDSYFFQRGQLLQKAVYANTGSAYRVVSREQNTYSAFTLKDYEGVGFRVAKLHINDGLYAPSGNIPVHANPEGSSDNGAYMPVLYSIFAGDNYLISKADTVYDQGDTTKYVPSKITYDYGSDTTHQQVINTVHVDSKGNTRATNNKYAFNYPAGNAVIDTMVNRHMYADEIEQKESYTIGAGIKTTAAQLHRYKTGSISSAIVPDKISILNIAAPVTNFTVSTVSAGSLTADSRYTQMIGFDQYDTQNNLAQYTPRNGAPVSILWDYFRGFPVAQVKNATNSLVNAQVAYTSFEAPGYGGWFYTGVPVSDPAAPTGSMVYPLNQGAVSSPSMDSAEGYVVSLWSNNGAPTVTAGSSITGMPLRTNAGWTYYEYPVPAGHTSVTVTGIMAIDELRIYPADAQMTTYAYDISGITDIADTRGGVSHFEYDAFNRLKNTRDWAGNIVKNYGYHTFDQVYGNTATGDTTIARNNCPAGTTPTSTTYSIAANKYYAATAADANAEALYDRRTNGQLKANTVCGCPVHNISYTLSNSTGLFYTVTFSGIAAPYTFPTSGSTIISVPEGTYTVTTSTVSTSHTFTMSGRSPVTGHSASFSSVPVTTGSPNLTLSITP